MRAVILGICVTSSILRVLLSGLWVLGLQFPSPRNPFPGSRVSGSRVPGSRVSGSQPSCPDFRLCPNWMRSIPQFLYKIPVVLRILFNSDCFYFIYTWPFQGQRNQFHNPPSWSLLGNSFLRTLFFLKFYNKLCCCASYVSIW